MSESYRELVEVASCDRCTVPRPVFSELEYRTPGGLGRSGAQRGGQRRVARFCRECTEDAYATGEALTPKVQRGNATSVAQVA